MPADLVAASNNHAGRFDRAVVKLLIVFAAILAIALSSKGAWRTLGLMAAIALIFAMATGCVQFRFWLRWLKIAAWCGILAIGIPMSVGFAGRWEAFFDVWLRSATSVSFVLAVMHTTPASDLFRALATLGFPQMLVTIAAMMHRYLQLLMDEFVRMDRARQSRSAGGSLFGRWNGLARQLGNLFLRSLERSERVHQAMLSRGWTGTVPSQSDGRSCR